MYRIVLMYLLYTTFVIHVEYVKLR